MRFLKVLFLVLLAGCVSSHHRGDLLGKPYAFVGIPRRLSETTFQDQDGFERGLLIEVIKVKSGTMTERMIEFPVPADQPSPLKMGVRYLITGGEGRHGRIILDYREIK